MRTRYPFVSARAYRTSVRHAANVAVYAVTFPILFPFALLHELVHLAGFGLMRCAGFRVEGIRLAFATSLRTAPLLCFSPVSVTVDHIGLDGRPRWYHRAVALLAAVGPVVLALAGLLFARHVAAVDGHTPLYYAAILFTAVMIPSLDDLRAAHWSLRSPTLEASAYAEATA